MKSNKWLRLEDEQAQQQIRRHTRLVMWTTGFIVLSTLASIWFSKAWWGDSNDKEWTSG